MLRFACAAGWGTVMGAAAAAALLVMPHQAAGQELTDPGLAGRMCRAGERVLFQCRAGRKFIAVCAGGTAAVPTVQYRYGRPGRIELAYPESGRDGLSWAMIGYSGGGEIQINFANRDTRYSVYSRMVRTRFDGMGNEPRFTAGVAVIRGNQILADIPCAEPADPWIDEAATRALLLEGEPTRWWDLEE